jgi:hypothetical protein
MKFFKMGSIGLNKEDFLFAKIRNSSKFVENSKNERDECNIRRHI